MIYSKVDTRFLGTIQNSFCCIPTLPTPVKIFFTILAISVFSVIIFYTIKKLNIISQIKDLINKTNIERNNVKKQKTNRTNNSSKKKHSTKKISTDENIVESLILNKNKIDIFIDRNGQRTLAAVATLSGREGLDLVMLFNDAVSAELLQTGSIVKCVFNDMSKAGKKINAMVGKVKNISGRKGAVITRTSSFGYIKRRSFARRKVADQRYLKIKIWRLEEPEFDAEYILDNNEPDITIDNHNNVGMNEKVPLVVDISKGGIALCGTVRKGGSLISRNDKILLAMLIYMPKKKTFQPHLIYAEARSAKAAGQGMVRLSFQFLRSLKIPPRKRSTLFKGQAVMAMHLSQPKQDKK